MARRSRSGAAVLFQRADPVGDARPGRDDVASRSDRSRLRRLAAVRHPARRRRARERGRDMAPRRHVRLSCPQLGATRQRELVTGPRHLERPVVRLGWSRHGSGRQGHRRLGRERVGGGRHRRRPCPSGGRPWGAPSPLVALLTPSDTPRVEAADVALDPSGRAVAAWSRELRRRQPGLRVLAPRRRAVERSGARQRRRDDRPRQGGHRRERHRDGRVEGRLRHLRGAGRLGEHVVAREDAAVHGQRRRWLGSGDDLDLAVDRGGKPIVVWVEYGRTNAAVKPVGGTWSAPKTLSGDGAASPKVTIDATGNAVVPGPGTSAGRRWPRRRSVPRAAIGRPPMS